MKCIVTDTDINIYSLDRWVGRFYSFCPNCFLYTLRVSELWNKNIIIQIEININDGSIKYENEFEQNYMKVKDRIYKLYTENPGFIII